MIPPHPAPPSAHLFAPDTDPVRWGGKLGGVDQSSVKTDQFFLPIIWQPVYPEPCVIAHSVAGDTPEVQKEQLDTHLSVETQQWPQEGIGNRNRMSYKWFSAKGAYLRDVKNHVVIFYLSTMHMRGKVLKLPAHPDPLRRHGSPGQMAPAPTSIETATRF